MCGKHRNHSPRGRHCKSGAALVPPHFGNPGPTFSLSQAESRGPVSHGETVTYTITVVAIHKEGPKLKRSATFQIC